MSAGPVPISDARLWPFVLIAAALHLAVAGWLASAQLTTASPAVSPAAMRVALRIAPPAPAPVPAPKPPPRAEPLPAKTPTTRPRPKPKPEPRVEPVPAPTPAPVETVDAPAPVAAAPPAVEPVVAAPAPAVPAPPAPSEADIDAYLRELARLITAEQRYPALARRRGLEGTVVIALRLGEDGSVASLELGGSAPSLFHRPTEEAIRRVRRFPPPPAGLSGTLELPIRYRLRD